MKGRSSLVFFLAFGMIVESPGSYLGRVGDESYLVMSEFLTEA